MKHLRLITFLLTTGASCNLFASMATDHKVTDAAGSCTDISQPATLKCAPAPSAKFDQQGKLWVAWSYAGHVYVSHSEDKAKTFSQPIAVNRTPEPILARGENRPKIISTDEHIYVTWTTPLKKRFTGNVRFSISKDNGKHFSEPITVNDNLDITGHRFEAISVNDEGEIFMAWLDKRDRLFAEQKGNSYNGAALYYSWSIDDGKTFQSNIKITDHSCECCRVAMDIDHNQLPVILWRNIYGKNTRDHSLVNFTDTKTPKQIQRISHDDWNVDACPHHGPDMDITNNKEIHLTWFNNAPERHGLFYAKRKAYGTLSSTINFGDYKAAASHPNVISVDNNVWLVWKQFDGKQESIWLQQSATNGESWSTAQKIIATNDNADYPFLLKQKNSVYLQWQTKNEGFQLIELPAQ